MDEKFIEILKQAGEVFLRLGIKSVTMDDIARELGVSKKTLYKYVSDKDDLVNKVMEAKCQMEQMMCTQIMGEYDNAIDELIAMSKHVGEMVGNMHPSIHYDLEKYYHKAWKTLNDHKNGFIQSCIEQNLTTGMEQGLYRDNMNPVIIARLYTRKVDMVFDSQVFPPNEFRFGDVHLELVRYHIRGIASPKGLEYLNERMKEEKIKF